VAKFELGQAVKVVHGSGEPFCGRITEITPPKTYYRVEAKDEGGKSFFMVVDESWLEPDEEPEMVWRRAKIPNLDTGCLAQSLTSLCFAIGGSHVAGWVEEAERAAWKGMVVKYE
jgi:hypothetical protein